MLNSSVSEEQISQVRGFFEREVCRKGTASLKDGVQIALFIDHNGPLTLTKEKNLPVISCDAPSSPDLTFWVPNGALALLLETQTEDVGELGVAILKLMTHSDPDQKIKAKVHIGVLDIILKGYLGVIPLGGATVMKFLASQGLGGLGKIKEAISKFRD